VEPLTITFSETGDKVAAEIRAVATRFGLEESEAAAFIIGYGIVAMVDAGLLDGPASTLSDGELQHEIRQLGDAATSILDIEPGDFVKVDDSWLEVAEVYGRSGRQLAKPSEGGFGVITTGGRNVGIFEARAYRKEDGLAVQYGRVRRAAVDVVALTATEAEPELFTEAIRRLTDALYPGTTRR
jgi:hypothetical protein